MKRKQPEPGYELVSPIPFPMTISIALSQPSSTVMYASSIITKCILCKEDDGSNYILKNKITNEMTK